MGTPFSRQLPDSLEDYINEFGALGPTLHTAVVKARTSVTTSAPTSTIALSQPTIIHSGSILLIII